MVSVIIILAGFAVAGILVGLIPYFVGKAQGKPNMGQWGFLCCIIVSIACIPLLLPVMVGFVIASLVTQNDMRPLRKRADSVNSPYVKPPVQQMAPAAAVFEQPPVAGLCLKCLSGPLKGRSYNIGRQGLLFGRDVDCGVRFSNETGGISRHHCSICWQQGTIVLMDLGSSYGTFQGDGRRLPPNYPVNLAPGSRFYLANPSNLFEVQIL